MKMSGNVHPGICHRGFKSFAGDRVASKGEEMAVVVGQVIETAELELRIDSMVAGSGGIVVVAILTLTRVGR